MSNKCILIISDTHSPYHHPDLIPFLKAIKKKYKPDRIVHIGDETDKHGLNFHGQDPDLPSAGDELYEARETIHDIEKLWSNVDLLHSNHGSLAYRRAFKAGLPKAYMRDYNEVLEVGKGWKWHNELTIKLPDGNDVHFHHGKSANILAVGQKQGTCYIQGHFHTKFNIQYWGNPNSLLWCMQVGCLIDKDALAFAYDKVFKDRPIIGCGIVIDSQPKLLPMVLNKGGRWNKVCP